MPIMRSLGVMTTREVRKHTSVTRTRSLIPLLNDHFNAPYIKRSLVLGDFAYALVHHINDDGARELVRELDDASFDDVRKTIANDPLTFFVLVVSGMIGILCLLFFSITWGVALAILFAAEGFHIFTVMEKNKHRILKILNDERTKFHPVPV